MANNSSNILVMLGGVSPSRLWKLYRVICKFFYRDFLQNFNYKFFRMWVAAATYCAILAPKGLLATLIGVLGMAHFSLGRGSGSFCGGFLIGQVGTREAFRYMGIFAVLGGCAYYALHLLWLKKFDATADKDDQECAENGENEKLTSEPKMKDQSTTMSQERLSLMIKFNQIGSLSSLPRGSKVNF